MKEVGFDEQTKELVLGTGKNQIRYQLIIDTDPYAQILGGEVSVTERGTGRRINLGKGIVQGAIITNKPENREEAMKKVSSYLPKGTYVI